MEDEIQLLKHFYKESSNEEKQQMEKEINEIEKRYSPKINISIVNGGMFYLYT